MYLILSHELVLQLPSREKCGKRMSYKAEKLSGLEGKDVKENLLNLGGKAQVVFPVCNRQAEIVTKSGD